MKPPDPLDHPWFHEPDGALDRFVALLEEDQALRHAEYDKPDPKRRRLKVACNECEQPWCCNQRVSVEIVEALAIYRWASEHAPRELAAALKRGAELHAKPPLTDAEHFRKRMPCPFLDRGRCTIFPVRPSRCRSHYMAGNPLKCRDQLAPADTYEMNPDNALLAELATVADDVRFHGLVEGMKPDELAEVLLLIDRVTRLPPWKKPRVLDWDCVE